MNFKEGVGTATAIKLYKAGATTLSAKEGTSEGAVGFTVKPGAFKSFAVTPIPAEPQAGLGLRSQAHRVGRIPQPARRPTRARTSCATRARKPRPTARRPNTRRRANRRSLPAKPRSRASASTRPRATTLKVTEEATGHEGQATFTVKAGPAASFRLSAPAPAEPEAGQAFNVTITALDAGGNVATSYGGAGGQNKTIAYSGPLASPSGKAPEYPGSATTVNFQRRRRQRERHQALPLRLEHAHGQGRDDRRVDRPHRQARPVQVLRRHAAPGRTAGGQRLRSEARRMGRIPQPADDLHAHAQAALLRRRSLALGQGARILAHERTDVQLRRSHAHGLPLLQGRRHDAQGHRRNDRPRRHGRLHGQGRPREDTLARRRRDRSRLGHAGQPHDHRARRIPEHRHLLRRRGRRNEEPHLRRRRRRAERLRSERRKRSRRGDAASASRRRSASSAARPPSRAPRTA